MNLTVAKRMKRDMQNNQVAIMNILDLDDISHNTFQYECGIAFLNSIFPEGTSAFKKHAESKLYWSWYRVQFSACQDSFIKRVMTFKRIPLGLVRNMYEADMLHFVVRSHKIMESFKNYLKIR